MLHLHSLTFNPFAENTYIIYNDKKDCWIVDPGMHSPQETKVFTELLQKDGLTPRGIINTHAHIDHILGVQGLKDTYNIPFFLHQLDLPMLHSLPAVAKMYGFGDMQSPACDGYIDENKPLQLGSDTIEVRLTPGHSPGSVVFYYPEGQWLIGGDVLFQGSIGRTDLPGGDFATLEQSIRTQLYTLPGNTTVYPGHSGPTMIGVEKQSNPFVKD